ncbi:MAG: hypothetical protein ACMUEM_06850 [Flavobacteriales bacterium AspAUS03]
MGYGWLSVRSFNDFNGSIIVHSVGGWGALIEIPLLRVHITKYNVQVKAIEVHKTYL